MRNKILLVPLLLIITANAFGQIRDYVFIVRPDYGPEMESLLDSVQQELRNVGYSNLAEYYSKSGFRSFGSGFHYKTPDGEHFIITNYHVIAGAESAVIEWQDDNGRNQSTSATDIVAIDEELDLAIIRVNEGFTFKPALTFAQNMPDDGAEVWSAGYPGLGGNPSWQLGQGTITNHRLWLDELIDSDRSYLIQHSAPVDPGNSGGPLLIKTSGTPSGYEVIGINTWKVFSRQATNFAVPATTIRDYLDTTTLSLDQAEDPTEIYDQLIKISELYAPKKEEEDFSRIWNLSRLISNEMVAVYGKDALLSVLSAAPTDIRDGVLGSIAGASPLEGLRVATAYQFDQDLRTLTRSLEDKGEIEERGDHHYGLTIPVPDGQDGQMEWVYEYQTWRISALGESEPAVAEVKEETGNQEQIQPDRNRESTNRARNNTADFIHHFNFDYTVTEELVTVMRLSYFYSINNYFLLGAGFGLGSVSMAYDTYNKDSDSVSSGYSFMDFVQFAAIARAQAVIGSSRLAIIPFAEVQIGGQIDSSDTIGSGFLLSPGAGLYFASNGYIQFKYGATYNYMMVLNGDNFSNPGTSFGKSCFTLAFGIGI